MNYRKISVTLMALLLATSQANADDLLSGAKNMMGDDAMLSGLASSLNLNAAQAGGGIGSLLSLAENKLSATDYQSITAAIPGAEKYVGMAKDAGVLTDPITDVGRLNSALQNLGISEDASASLFSKLGDMVGTAGGADLKGKLMGLLQ